MEQQSDETSVPLDIAEKIKDSTEIILTPSSDVLKIDNANGEVVESVEEHVTAEALKE